MGDISRWLYRRGVVRRLGLVQQVVLLAKQIVLLAQQIILVAIRRLGVILGKERPIQGRATCIRRT